MSSGLSYAVSAVALILVAWGISTVVRGIGIAGLVLGADKRGSTSKAQALLWTVALSFALLSLLMRDPTKISNAPVSQDYLYLLGFPAATVVASKGITLQKTASGRVAKGPASADDKDAAASETTTSGNAANSGAKRWQSFKSAFGDLFADDAGNPSLHDTQLVLFTLIAVAWYLVTFFKDPSQPFPNLPDTLLVLTGVATATYVGGKLVASQKPAITAMFPSQPETSTTATITGANFTNTGGPGGGEKPEVSFGSKHATAVSADSNRLTVNVPDGVEGNDVEVKVLNADGLISDALHAKIVKKADDGQG